MLLNSSTLSTFTANENIFSRGRNFDGPLLIPSVMTNDSNLEKCKKILNIQKIQLKCEHESIKKINIFLEK